METTTFQKKECYVAYKEFKKDDKCICQLNNWYRLKEDSTDFLKYFLLRRGLFKNPFSGFLFGYKVFKCFIPKGSVISNSIKNEEFVQCYEFYLSSEEIDINQFDWNTLTDKEKKIIILNNPPNFNYEKYWNELTEEQKNYCRDKFLKR